MASRWHHATSIPTLLHELCFYREDYWGRFTPESRALAHTVSECVDPNGLFKSRKGGGNLDSGEGSSSTKETNKELNLLYNPNLI